MPDPSTSGPLPPDVAVRVRAYLAAFLPPAAIDEAVDEVATDSGFWGDTDVVEVLAVAHTVLASRLRIAPEVEALVLQEDVGLDVPGVAGVLGLAPTDVRDMLDEALAVLGDPELADATPGGTAPALPDEREPAGSATAVEPAAAEQPQPEATAATPVAPARPMDGAAPTVARRRRQRLLVLAAVAAVVLVALGAAWVLARGDDCPAEAGICVTETVLTDAVDPATGEPGDDREVFDVDDAVTLWFAFERQAADPGPVEVAWYREGVLLYGTEVRLGDGDRLNVSLAELWSEEPGRYRVEVVDGDRILAQRDFRVTGEG